jgi:hypothetical protein
MITSALNSVNITNPKPIPWGWNPVATFQTAMTEAQENNRAQERFAIEAELSRILLPEKMAKAEFNIKKLAYDSKLLELSHRAETADLDNRMRVIASGGNSGGGADAGATSNPDGSFKSKYGFGLGMNTQTTPAARPKVSWKIVTPAAPATPQTGP